MKISRLLAIAILIQVLSACATTDSPVMNANPPLATGGQDAATFAAKTY